jgi:hypothetical protein
VPWLKRLQIRFPHCFGSAASNMRKLHEGQGGGGRVTAQALPLSYARHRKSRHIAAGPPLLQPVKQLMIQGQNIKAERHNPLYRRNEEAIDDGTSTEGANMNWIKVKTQQGTDMLVDLDKVVQIRRHSKGSQLVLTQIVPNKIGKDAPRTLVVREKLEDIEGKVAGRKTGLLS